jgi:XTP/dITP diphosphohydrolase
MIPQRLVLATANPGKVRELGALVAGWGPVAVVSLDAFPRVRCPEETGSTYEENAIAKAAAIAAATRLPALGDDSGLEVDALGGAPGVRSARWAGASATDADRIAKLLRALRDVPAEARGARFRCVVALAWPDGRVETAAGECAGTIATAPSGAGGFGYDPVFVAAELGRTFGEATAEDKRRLSHRARAVGALGRRLATLRGGGGPC